MPRKTWVFDPDSGGQKIPERIKAQVKRRIEGVAQEHFEGRYARLDIRFRGQFCYIDAYQDADTDPYWPPAGWPETREEYVERMRNTPIHLCRLRYFGGDRWGFAFYTYSNERYELSMYPDGDFLGTPEEAFLVSANAYLSS
jgi:hypothetical protein